jgi:16S rRNA processing protein RimM
VAGVSKSDEKILVGRIGAAHGIAGEVRITTFTAEPLAIGSYGPLLTDRPGITVAIEKARQSKGIVIARLEGVADRNAAEALNGTALYITREKLPPPDDEDDFYHSDLIGLEARLDDGHVLGEVVAVPNYGAGDILEVKDPRSGDTYLYPFTRAVVPEVRIAEGYLVIAPPLDVEPGEEEPN